MKSKKKKKIPKKIPFFHIKRNEFRIFSTKRKIIKFLSKRNIFQYGKYFSPNIHDCLNNTEIILFITFRIIPWILLYLFYFLLVFSSTLGNSKSLNFFDFSFFFTFISFSFKISKTPTKTTDISPSFLSFFFFLSFFLSFSQVSLLLRLLTWHLVWILFFCLSMRQATNQMIH